MEENKDTIEKKELEENNAQAEENTEAADGENAENAENGEEPKKKGNIVRDIVEIAESTLITVFVIVLIFTFILHPVNIVGRSMVPTLNNTYEGVRAENKETDKVLMNTVFFNVKYGDILVIDKDKNYLLDENGKVYEPTLDPSINECIIKRVIAVGGQTVDIKDGKVYVDGEVLNEPYIAENSTTDDLGAFTGQYPVTVPEGYYFVMGDNRNHSTDSRAKSVGLVKKDQIYGKAIIKYSPLDEFDILTDSWKGD
ncbi:MAG: signal peptidase I [Ruminococcus sp.]|nr:signal peptidase I [Ruminococcus sp.]